MLKQAEEFRKAHQPRPLSFASESDFIGVHPNDNTATIWLKTEDLANIIQEHGNEIEVVSV